MDKRKKVYVGMSGGVDSSLSAAFLKEAGYDVTGVFIKVWQPDFIECTWKEDRLDAMRVAAQLDIPFVTLDLEKEYKEGVVDYMIREYKEGRTPNPDVMCNAEVKFGAFWEWARAQGAQYVATGHYAVTDGARLLLSQDANKDQTYFLWKLREDDLSHTLFPIGHLTKELVRQEAEKRGLYTSHKKDSQGLCFVGTIDMKTLLKEYIAEEPGDVVAEDGTVIGSHDGSMFYTIGERHGFSVHEKATDQRPYYVVGKDKEKNQLVVSHEQKKTVSEKEFSLTEVSWVTEGPKAGVTYQARGRYRAPLCEVVMNGNTVTVTGGGCVYTPGQSFVVYDGQVCLGGGVMQ